MSTESKNEDPLIDTVIGAKYRIISKIGSGGMGGIYRGIQLLIDRPVAIKILKAQLSVEDTLRKRFHQEAKTVSHLSHPNAVTLYDFGIDNGIAYLVMELIDGKSLKQIIAEEGKLELPRVRNIILQSGSAIREAHKMGIVHRDIKPENIMVKKNENGEDWVKVLDFGIAKNLGTTITSDDPTLTQHGMIMGTPKYMSPEQCRGEQVDHRADIYSLGALTYELVTGDSVIKGDNNVELMVKIINSPIIPPSRRLPTIKIPEDCEKFILKSLERNPANRHQNIDEFLDDLKRSFPYSSEQSVAIKNSKKLFLISTIIVLVLPVLTFLSLKEFGILKTNEPVKSQVKIIEQTNLSTKNDIRELVADLKSDSKEIAHAAYKKLKLIDDPLAKKACEIFRMTEESGK